MKCQKCGTQVEDGTQTCPNCGASLATEDASGVVYKDGRRVKKVISIPVVAVVAVGVAIIAAIGAFIFTRPSGQEKKPAEQPAQQQPVDNKADAAKETATSNTEKQDEKPAEKPAEKQDAATIDGITARANLSEYSWEELGKISDSLKGKTRDEALAALAKYNLVGKDGSMLDATKEVNLGAFGTIHVRLVDVLHDKLADGSNASLTFLASDISCAHRINGTNTNNGGWRDSEMRGWLNSDVYNAVPADLKAAMKMAAKQTNNDGETKNAASVTITEDALWIPSTVEVGGPTSYTWESNPADSPSWNAVVNAEGSQYAYFAPRISNNAAPNDALRMMKDGSVATWWLRSPTPSKNFNFRKVDAGGDPSGWEDATKDLGVCIGFCV